MYKSEMINIESGIFQGDSSSPLLFCVSIIPVSIVIKNENKQYLERIIVEIGICCDQNLQKKLEEKRTKHVKLAVEISKLRRWRTVNER